MNGLFHCSCAHLRLNLKTYKGIGERKSGASLYKIASILSSGCHSYTPLWALISQIYLKAWLYPKSASYPVLFFCWHVFIVNAIHFFIRKCQYLFLLSAALTVLQDPSTNQNSRLTRKAINSLIFYIGFNPRGTLIHFSTNYIHILHDRRFDDARKQMCKI